MYMYISTNTALILIDLLIDKNISFNFMYCLYGWNISS